MDHAAAWPIGCNLSVRSPARLDARQVSSEQNRAGRASPCPGLALDHSAILASGPGNDGGIDFEGPVS